FFDIEDYKDRVDLLSKCYTYMVYFNTLRINRYKGGVTPLKIAYEAGDKSKIDYNKLIKFKPVILDLFSSDYCKMSSQGVYHVSESDTSRTIFTCICSRYSLKLWAKIEVCHGEVDC
ncbi:MAG: hypothetical protein DRP91_05685, partial [Candidatus Neomarinimicrobiota bacterium]